MGARARALVAESGPFEGGSPKAVVGLECVHGLGSIPKDLNGVQMYK